MAKGPLQAAWLKPDYIMLIEWVMKNKQCLLYTILPIESYLFWRNEIG